MVPRFLLEGRRLEFSVRLQNAYSVRSIENTVASRPTDIHRQRFGDPHHAIRNFTTMLDDDEFNRLVEGPNELVATLPHISGMHFSRHRWPLEDKRG